nr:HlyD family efflux transporter periplasmic adaptor subunit [uncultured Cohaesibacter sp.]
MRPLSSRRSTDRLHRPETSVRPDADAQNTAAALVMDEHAAFLEALLGLEAEARRVSRLQDLSFLIANETRRLTGARQIFVFRKRGSMRMSAISGLPRLDRNAALIQQLERLVGALAPDQLEETSVHELAGHPFPQLLWQPLVTLEGRLLGGFLLAGEHAWDEAQVTLARRLGDCYAHAMDALLLKAGVSLRLGWLAGKRSRLAALGIGAALLILAIPVRMSVLAPMEISAHKPFVVAAPIDGVIEDVLVNPGDKVTEGTPLVRMGGVELQNRVQLARQEVQVAEARLKKSNQLAFSDDEGRKELSTAMANLDLKRAELRYAEDLFERSSVRAERDGVVVLSDKQALIGKPVVTGERIMQIADPGETELVVRVPVRDALVLKPGARVKAFLDSDPLASREAKILFADYQALPDSASQLSFRVVAAFADPTAPTPRLGVRGTAQIYGARTVLGMYLFRRPLTALRQWIGL